MTCSAKMRGTKPPLSSRPTSRAWLRAGRRRNCYPSCATINGTVTPYAFYTPQFSSLYAWRSTGNSAYNSGQFSLRHRANGLEFDLNYTYSKSIDLGSDAERVSLFEGLGFGASQVINSWAPNQNRAVSDFDATHQLNANWVYEFPMGHGKRFGSGMGRFANAMLSGWTISGLWRWSTGYPFTEFSPAWSTNFDLESPVVPLSSRKPQTGSFIVAQASGGTGPNVFKDPGITDPTNPIAAINLVRPAYPGEGGSRNWLRGPGTFNLDSGLAKIGRSANANPLGSHGKYSTSPILPASTWAPCRSTATPRCILPPASAISARHSPIRG